MSQVTEKSALINLALGKSVEIELIAAGVSGLIYKILGGNKK